MLRRMRESLLPVEAAAGDARHRDVRAQVFAVVPQQPRIVRQAALLAHRIVPRALSRRACRLLRRLRGS